VLPGGRQDSAPLAGVISEIPRIWEGVFGDSALFRGSFPGFRTLGWRVLLIEGSIGAGAGLVQRITAAKDAAGSYRDALKSNEKPQEHVVPRAPPAAKQRRNPMKNMTDHISNQRVFDPWSVAIGVHELDSKFMLPFRFRRRLGFDRVIAGGSRIRRMGSDSTGK
jgi:hypothetical protein